MKEVYDEKVQHDVVGPVFCIDYPREVSPLARAHRDDPDYVERFELFAIVAMALVLSFLATLYPAWKAASTDPVQVLRYE